jgi:hypothetical protein
MKPFEPSEWQDYGAVYEYDELMIEEEYTEGYGSRFSTSYTFNQKLIIINKKGFDYGTLSIPLLTDQLATFEVEHVLESGELVQLDLEKLKKDFLQTGDIAIPQVQTGSRISLLITFVEAEPLIRFEHEFEREIPVLLGRFSFFHDFETGYAMRSYYTSKEPLVDNFNGKKGIILEEVNVIPSKEWGWNSGLATEGYYFPRYPRVAVNINNYRSVADVYNRYSWKDYAQSYRDYVLDTTFSSSDNLLQAEVERIKKAYSETYAQADAILQYVQENITLTDRAGRDSLATDLDEVMQRKSGDYLEVSMVLTEMLKKAGMDTSLYVTRSRDSGGFDQELPGWGQLSIPLVSVNIDNRELIAYPFLHNSVLGEYPLSYHDVKALHLADGAVVDLPAPLHADNTFVSEATLRLAENVDEIQWQCSLGESLAVLMRHYVAEYDNDKKKRFWKGIVQKYDELNIVQHPELVIDRGNPLLLESTVTNKNIAMNKSGQTYVDLGVFFRSYFSKLDDMRTQPYINDFELLYEEGVTLVTTGADDLTINFHCKDQDNVLFKTECSNRVENNEQHLHRKITFKKVNIPAESWINYSNDIRQLNEIKESSLIQGT